MLIHAREKVKCAHMGRINHSTERYGRPSRVSFLLLFLSATLTKSGPLDFPSEKSFLLFFAHEKGLGHIFQK